MIQDTLLDILALNREELMQGSHSATKILSIIHRSYPDLHDTACLLSLSLSDSIARMVFHADYQRAISISEQALTRYGDTEHIYYVCRHLLVIGRSQALSGSASAAHASLLRALDLSHTHLSLEPHTLRLRSEILHDLAMNNSMSGGSPAISADYLRQALATIAGTDFAGRKAICLMGLGNIKYTEAKIEEALDFYLQAEQIFDAENSFTNWASVSSNIGICYLELGRYDLSERHLSRSLSLRRKVSNPDEVAISLFNLALLYERKGNIEKAIVHFIACRTQAARTTNKKLYHDAVLKIESLSGLQSEAITSLFARYVSV